MNIKLYQTYFDEHTKQHLDSQFTPYFNAKCTKYFVDQIIVDMYDAGLMKDCDYFGIWSWRAKQKVDWVDDIRGFINDNPGYDYYYVRPKPYKYGTNVWQHCRRYQRDDCEKWTARILAEMDWPNVDMLGLNAPIAEYGYNICKSKLYEEYASCLKFCIQIIEDNRIPGLEEWVWQDSEYTRLCAANPARKDNVTPERLREICGVPYYTKHHFITYYLFATFAALMGWKGKVLAETFE